MPGDTFVRSMMGDQLVSSRVSAPSFGFGSSTRENREKMYYSEEHAKLAVGTNRSPGPTTSGGKSIFGAQFSSALESEPQWVFGTSDRWAKPGAGKGPNPPNAYTQRIA